MKYLIMLLSLISFNVLGDVTCSFKGSKVLYTNGVLTPKESAFASLRKIIDLSLDASIDVNPGVIEYDLAFNHHESFAADLIESTVQRLPDVFIHSLSLRNPYAAFKHFIGGEGSLLKLLAPDEYEDILSVYRRVQVSFMRNYFQDSQYLNTLEMIRDEYYLKNLNAGFRIFAISHSQGGLFMEDAYRELEYEKKDKFFSGFQIASPVLSSGLNKKGHATHDKDLIIKFISETIGTIDTNIDAPLLVENTYFDNIDYLDFVLNHGIVTTYLFDSTIKTRVIEEFKKAADLLESNCPVAVINNSATALKLSLDSTDPEDPELTDVVYQWDFGDGNTAETPQKVFSHTYLNPGVYTVTLRVTNKENREFWPKSTIKKQITVGEVKCSGEPGNIHINPNGSVGGYVSNKATVASTVTLGRLVEVCGDSQILGSSRIDTSLVKSVVNNSLLIDTFIGGGFDSFNISNSTISGSSIDFVFDLNIKDSSLMNTVTDGNPFTTTIIASTLTDVTFFNYSGGDIVVNFSSIKSGNLKTRAGSTLVGVNLLSKSVDVFQITIDPIIRQVVSLDGTEWTDSEISNFLSSDSGLN